MNPRPSFDATIPVLTEVFQDVPAKAEAGAMAAETDLAMAALERRLCERIVHRLQDQAKGVLEQRLRDSMEQALQHATPGLIDALRASLQQSIEDIVARAVAQELAHLHTLDT